MEVKFAPNGAQLGSLKSGILQVLLSWKTWRWKPLTKVEAPPSRKVCGLNWVLFSVPEAYRVAIVMGVCLTALTRESMRAMALRESIVVEVIVLEVKLGQLRNELMWLASTPDAGLGLDFILKHTS